MRMPDKNPDLWAQFLAWSISWFTANRPAIGYSAGAAAMVLLRAAYVGRDSWSKRFLDAAMCSLVAFCINDGLAALEWNSSWALLGSLFIGFFGIDYIGSILRRVVGNKTGTSDPQA